MYSLSFKSFVKKLIFSALLFVVSIFIVAFTIGGKPPQVEINIICEILGLLSVIVAFQLYKLENWKLINPKPVKIIETPVIIVIAFITRILLVIPVLLFVFWLNKSIVTDARQVFIAQSNAFGRVGTGSQIEEIMRFLFIVILGPLLEEIFFRGIVFGSLLKRFNFLKAALLSTGLFALVHGINPALFITTFILGLVASIVYYKRRNILYPITFHGAYNSLLYWPVLVNVLTSLFRK